MSYSGSVQKWLGSSQVFRSVLVYLCLSECVCVSASNQWKWLRWDIWITEGTMCLTWAVRGAHMKPADLTHACSSHPYTLHAPTSHVKWSVCGHISAYALYVTTHPVRLITHTGVCICSAGWSIPADIPIGCDLSACVFSSLFYTTNHYLKYFRDLL